ncbi:hypothetical protein JXB28_01175 [Candidatus Woesearchaeota archaeon]|nr:hypothetical protein [Candidatus Woesearchaeota archaeon]
MGMIENAIYRMIPKVMPKINEFEKKVEEAVASGKEIVDDINKGVSYTKNIFRNIGDYIDSGRPLGYVDKAANSIARGWKQILYGGFREMKDDFNRKYGFSPASSTGRSSGYAVPGQPVVQPAGYKPSQAPRPVVKPVVQPIAKPTYKPMTGPAAQPAVNPVVKPATQLPAQPAYKPIEEPAAMPKPNPIVMPQPKPAPKPAEKQLTLDSIVDEFKRKLKQLSPDIDADIDVYAPGGLLQSYASKYEHKKAEVTEVARVVPGAVKRDGKDEALIEAKAKPSSLESKLSSLKDKYAASYDDIGASKEVLDLYNQGYKAKDIIRESKKNGYQVRSFKDIATNMAAAISAGAAYVRSKYNGLVATALGATEQVINDYLSGKSYAQIKENLKQRAGGMKISDSTILRVMHNYENNTGTKVVGNRKGSGSRKGKNVSGNGNGNANGNGSQEGSKNSGKTEASPEKPAEANKK